MPPAPPNRRTVTATAAGPELPEPLLLTGDALKLPTGLTVTSLGEGDGDGVEEGDGDGTATSLTLLFPTFTVFLWCGTGCVVTGMGLGLSGEDEGLEEK